MSPMSPSATDEPRTLGLSTLAEVPLSEENQALLDRLGDVAQGPAPWRARKRAEARDLLALATIAPRLEVLALDLATELLAVVRMAVPVPCLPASGELIVLGTVDLALRYPEEILRGPLPGYALVEIPMPRRIWHPNISTVPSQRLCLGANVPKGYPLREAVLASYAALTLQSITLDRADPAGVMNGEALRFWSEHLERIPLSTAAFLDVVGAEAGCEGGGS